MAAAVPKIVPFLSAPNAIFTPFRKDNVDVALWTLGSQTLLMAANSNSGNMSLVLQGAANGKATELFNSGAELVRHGSDAVLILEAMGASGLIFQNVDHGKGIAIGLS